MAKPTASRSAPRHRDVFFRHMVGNMRNGVLAIDRDGRHRPRQRRSPPAVPLPPTTDHRHAVRGRPARAPRHRPRARRRLRDESLPNRAELRLKIHRHGHRLHTVAGARRKRRAGRRGAVLQGPDARRTDGRARAAARSAGRGRRDGGGDGARDQEPARRHRSAGRAAAPQGAGERRRAVARRRHHQRSQDGERDRAGGAGVRAAGAAAGRPHVAGPSGGQRGVDGRR